MSGRIKMFHQWLLEEQKDLEEECGANLSGIVDKLEETFPEISGKYETDDVLEEQLEEQLHILNTTDDGLDWTHIKLGKI